MIVVPDNTMKMSAVLGRDVLNKFNLGFMALPKIKAEVIKEIFAADIENDNILDSLIINSEIDLKLQSEVKNLFFNEYLNKEKPEFANIKIEMVFRLTDDEVINFGPRRLSFEEKRRPQKILDDLLARKIIRESNSIYASPIVLTKKNGELRFCIDFRFLNKITERLNYPFPLIEDLFDCLRSKKWFTLLDLKDGFHHISMSEESIKYTAFITPLGHFEFLKMTFGLKIAPPVFQKCINKIFEDLIRSGDVIIYLNDILIVSETIERHLKILKQVLSLMVENKLDLRTDKCKFLQTELEYLKYKVSVEGIKPDERGVSIVVDFPVPRNAREEQSFLGMCSYFRRFVAGFSMVAKPLFDLLKKDAKFEFGEDQFKAFETLKLKLIKSPVLSIYSLNDETELHCDASKLRFGAVLLQRKKDGLFHPIAYFSKRTTEAESKYHSFEIKTLAIVFDKMRHVDALSRAVNVMVVEDNTLESNLIISQNLDKAIVDLRENLQVKEDKLYEMRNGIVYRKRNGGILFYVPTKMENSVILKYHDEMGHFGHEKTVEATLQYYWFP